MKKLSLIIAAISLFTATAEAADFPHYPLNPTSRASKIKAIQAKAKNESTKETPEKVVEAGSVGTPEIQSESVGGAARAVMKFKEHKANPTQ